MSTTAKALLGARTQLSGAAAALNSLANLTYVILGTITFASSSKTSLACKLELYVTPQSVATNKKVSVFLQQSLDGTNFETGPTSGTTTTDEPNLTYLGDLECNTNATLQRKIFELTAAACGGALPHSAKVIAKNETGAALASSGNDCYYQMIDGDLT